MVAVPTLAGSGFRLLLGSTVDRVGLQAHRTPRARAAHSFPSMWGAVAATTYAQVLGIGVLLGIAGGSFAVALPLASRWYPAGAARASCSASQVPATRARSSPRSLAPRIADATRVARDLRRSRSSPSPSAWALFAWRSPRSRRAPATAGPSQCRCSACCVETGRPLAVRVLPRDLRRVRRPHRLPARSSTSTDSGSPR